MRIGLIGWYGHQNAGDERMLFCLKKFFHGNDFIVTNSFDNALRRIDELNTCDFIILGGGGLVLRGFNRYLKLINKIKTRFGCLGISVEAVHEDNIKFIAALIKKSEFIVVRDGQSKIFLGNSDKVIIAPDLTYLYPFDIVEPQKSEVCGINLRYWHFWKSYHGGVSFELMIYLNSIYQKFSGIYPFSKWESRKAVDIIKTKFIKIYPFSKWESRKAVDIIKTKFDKNLGIPLYLEDVYHNDYAIMKDIIHDIENDFSPEMFIKCKYFIGMRLHSLIFASQMGIPFISLSYQPKNIEFCKLLELPELSTNIYDLSELPDKINLIKNSHQEIREKILDYRNKSKNEIHLVMNSVSNVMKKQ